MHPNQIVGIAVAVVAVLLVPVGGVAAAADGTVPVEIRPGMGGEDFAYYTQHVPGCFVGLGVGNPDIDAEYNVHHPLFKVDESALAVGTAMHVCFAIESLAELEGSGQA